MLPDVNGAGDTAEPIGRAGGGEHERDLAQVLMSRLSLCGSRGAPAETRVTERR